MPKSYFSRVLHGNQCKVFFPLRLFLRLFWNRHHFPENKNLQMANSPRRFPLFPSMLQETIPRPQEAEQSCHPSAPAAAHTVPAADERNWMFRVFCNKHSPTHPGRNQSGTWSHEFRSCSCKVLLVHYSCLPEAAPLQPGSSESYDFIFMI